MKKVDTSTKSGKSVGVTKNKNVKHCKTEVREKTARSRGNLERVTPQSFPRELSKAMGVISVKSGSMRSKSLISKRGGSPVRGDSSRSKDAPLNFSKSSAKLCGLTPKSKNAEKKSTKQDSLKIICTGKITNLSKVLKESESAVKGSPKPHPYLKHISAFELGKEQQKKKEGGVKKSSVSKTPNYVKVVEPLPTTSSKASTDRKRVYSNVRSRSQSPACTRTSKTHKSSSQQVLPDSTKRSKREKSSEKSNFEKEQSLFKKTVLDTAEYFNQSEPKEDQVNVKKPDITNSSDETKAKAPPNVEKESLPEEAATNSSSPVLCIDSSKKEIKTKSESAVSSENSPNDLNDNEMTIDFDKPIAHFVYQDYLDDADSVDGLLLDAGTIGNNKLSLAPDIDDLVAEAISLNKTVEIETEFCAQLKAEESGIDIAAATDKEKFSKDTEESEIVSSSVQDEECFEEDSSLPDNKEDDSNLDISTIDVRRKNFKFGSLKSQKKGGKSENKFASTGTCNKCKLFSKKQIEQDQAIKNLQRRNSSLESILIQKRDLAEKLARQARDMYHENIRISKHVSDLSDALKEKSAQNIQNSSVYTEQDDKSTLTVNLNPWKDKESDKTLMQDSSTNTSDDASKTLLDKSINLSVIHGLNQHRKVAVTPEQLQQTDELIKLLEQKNRALHGDLDQIKEDHYKMNKFLKDILYTLCSRGFESIKDSEGREINLYRCKGEKLLDLRGRDARQRVGPRKTPPDILMKAYIGSMEKTIQNLTRQLKVERQDKLIGDRFLASVDDCTEKLVDPSSLEQEIMYLISMMEGICEGSPEIFSMIKEQYWEEHSSRQAIGIAVSTPMVDAILERCQKLAIQSSRSNLREEMDQVYLPQSHSSTQNIARRFRKSSTENVTQDNRQPSKISPKTPRPNTKNKSHEKLSFSNPRSDSAPPGSGTGFKPQNIDKQSSVARRATSTDLLSPTKQPSNSVPSSSSFKTVEDIASLSNSNR